MTLARSTSPFRSALGLASVAFAAVTAVAPLGTVASLTTACSSLAECDCIDPTIRVAVPPESAAAVTTVTLSGPACEGVSATCERPGLAGGCATFAFQAKAAGECKVDVDFATGRTFSTTVNVVAGETCCQGFYPSPAAAGQIEVSPASRIPRIVPSSENGG